MRHKDLRRWPRVFYASLVARICAGEMYCGHDDCYTVLEVSSSAAAADIKKAYRKLSLKWHPDKNLDNKEEATLMFQKISRAYEVLSNDEMRTAYDYARAHPEQAVYNQYKYYSVRVSQKVPLQYVVIGLLACITFIQLVNQWTLSGQYRAALKRTADFNRKLQQASQQRCSDLGLKSGSKLSRKENDKLLEELFCNSQVDGVKLSRIRIADLLIVQLLCSPWLIFKHVRDSRAIRREEAEEARVQLEQEKTELLEEQQREEQALRRRQIAKDRKEQESREVAAAKERHRAERHQVEEEQKREANNRFEATQRAREYITQKGKEYGTSLDDVRHLVAMSGPKVLSLVEALKVFGMEEARRSAFLAAIHDLKTSSSSSREAKDKTCRTPWHQDELAALAKGMQRLPGGTADRWGKICDFIEQTTGKARRHESEVTDMAKELKTTAGHGTQVIEKVTTPATVDLPSLSSDKIASKDEEWSQMQQLALEAALAKFPSVAGVTANDRWEKIASCIDGKTKKQCIARYKELCGKMQAATVAK